MKFKLIIFDLDQTLLQTSDLESFRGHANTGDVNEDYRRRLHHSANDNNRVQISEECILRIREMHDNAHIAIFTTSPRTYTETLLEIYYPNTTWDAIVTYEDVENTKPAPEGIHLASQLAGVNWGDQIALIGDNWKDIESSYRAGCWSILFKSSWPVTPQDWTNENYRALRLIPDAIANSEKELEWVMLKPCVHLPLLEQSCVFDGAPPKKAPVRIDPIRHFNKDKTSVLTLSLGRLFPENSAFAPRRAWHLVTHDIIGYKNAHQFPSYWIRAIWEAIQHRVCNQTNGIASPTVITVIPSKPGRIPRLEFLLQQLFDECPDSLLRDQIDFDPDILSHSTDARSHHGEHLNAEQRFRNSEKSLFVSETKAVQGKHIIVIDDVCTSGATMYHADAKLRKHGAVGVTCLSLTQTISP